MTEGFPAHPADYRSTHALVFGGAADVYDRSRPGYPAEAIADLLGPGPADVVDLGAGTGKLTAGLVGLGHRTVAVEPDAAMLAKLRAALPGVEAHEGSAERIPLPDRAFDAVVAGQAAHWFDDATAMPEIARVLRPHGRVGFLWNLRDESVPWVARFGELVGSLDAAGADDDHGSLGPLFTEPETRWYAHVQPLSVDQLVDLAHSRSPVLVLPPDERADRLEQVRALGDEVADGGVVEMPYRTQLWWASLS